MAAYGSWFGLVLIMLIGVWLRAASFRNYMAPDGGFRFDGPDPYDHLRRIYLGVKSFPSIPAFDSYAAYPKGLGQIWSPLYDYFLSMVALVSGGERAVQAVGFIANPAFTIVTIAVVFLVTRKLLNSNVGGLAAAFCVAVFPGHIAYTLAAKLDHHVLEPIAILILISVFFLGRKGDFTPLETICASLAFPLTILMWRGATLFWGIQFLYLLVRGGIEYSRVRAGFLYGTIRAYVAGAGAVALVCIFNTWGASAGFSYGIISWFHVCALLFFAFLIYLFGTATSLSLLCKRALILLILLSVSLFLPFVQTAAKEILSGVSFLGGGDSWLVSIGEQQSLFHWGFSGFLQTVTLLWFAMPAALVLAVRKWWSGGCADHGLLTMVIWISGMLPLLRLRYSVVLAVPVALATAYLLDYAWRRWPLNRQRAASCGLFLLMIAPAAGGYGTFLNHANPQVVAEGEFGRHGVFEWLRINTPQTSGYDSPRKTPEYGILSSWGLGSKIYYLARRPAVATAFGWEAHGIYEISGFLATGNPLIAYEIARRNSARYILMRDENYNLDFEIAKDGVGKGKLPAGTVDLPDQTGSVYQRLKYFDGSAFSSSVRFVPAISNFRLLYESDMQFDTPMMKVSHYKIFEAVPGAVIKGRCRPGEAVSIAISLRTSTGRTIPFSDKKSADASGNFEFRVPYSTGIRQGDTEPAGKYRIVCGNGEGYTVDVSEKAVMNGETVVAGR